MSAPTLKPRKLRMPKGPVARRLLVAVIIVAVLAVALFIARGAVHWLTAKDATIDGTALRSRLNTLEADPFVDALTATKHTTLSRQEVLTCERGDTLRHWNLREVVSGGIDQDAIDKLLASASSYGWQPGASGDYSKTIAPGVEVDLQAQLGDDNLLLVANASSGLNCY